MYSLYPCLSINLLGLLLAKMEDTHQGMVRLRNDTDNIAWAAWVTAGPNS